MSETTEAKPASQNQRPRRAKWRLFLGIGLLGAAGLMTVIRLLPLVLPVSGVRVMKPIPLRLPADLKPSPVVPAKPGELAGCNLLLVTFDTTRADRIGCYGNQGIETPNLDRLAHEGVVFTQATATAPVTLPSHASILTGLYPFHHGARVNSLSRLDEARRTLAEVLSQAGYATGAFVSAFVLDPQFGTAQGFQDYDAKVEHSSEFWGAVAERSADKTCELATAWLAERSGGPFFLWVHFYDPHWSYEPPSPYAEEYKRTLYDGEIAFADEQLGRLLDLLDEIDAGDKTLVVVAGDHGESLLQHDEPTHGCLLYESTLHVPLIMRCGKRLGAGVHVDRLVCLTDIMPTVLSLLGIEERPTMDGVDLTQPAVGARTVLIETLEGLAEYGWASLLGLRCESVKYIHGPNPALHDLSRDPNEEDNLISSRSDLAEDARRQLSEFFGGDLAKATSLEPTKQLSPADLARLESLGYVTAAKATDASESHPDPIEMMPVLRRMSVAIDPGTEGWVDKAIEELERIVLEHPDFYIAHRELATAYARKGDMERAEAAVNRCLELHPMTVIPLYTMASLKDRQKDRPGAIHYYRQVLELFPDHMPTLTRLGRLLFEEGQTQEAATFLKRAHEILPTHESLCIAAAEAMTAAGSMEDAVAALRQTLSADPKLGRARSRLAQLLKAQRRFDEAAMILREGLKLTPDKLDFAANLAVVLMSGPDPRGSNQIEAVAIMERVCEKTGQQNAEFMHGLSRAYASAGRVNEALTTAEKARRLALDSKRDRLAETIAGDIAVFQKAKEGRLEPTTTSAPG